MNDKTIAWLSYITIFGWVAAFFIYSSSSIKSSLSAFHLRQAFGIFVTCIASWLISAVLIVITLGLISIILWVLYLFLFLLWLLGLLSAIAGEEKPIPILGEQYQKWFSFIK
ncbi:MAG TPA: hypothetical protein VFN30_01285 [Chitinophagaceae bacterium]|nr:hypothetical protein [Chitinophagaceae bacterium]